MAIAQASVPTSLGAVFTASSETAITSAFFLNDSGSTVTLNIAVVPSGTGSPSISANGIIKSLSVESGDTYILDVEKIILGAGDTVQASASASSAIVATFSYVVV